MNLGILKVASQLRLSGITVDHLDLTGVKNFTEAVSAYMAKGTCEIFGISATTPQMPASVLIAKEIKQNNPNARVILGGPHGTLVNSSRKIEKKKGVVSKGHRAFQRLCDYFDTIVAGDGELSAKHAMSIGAPKLIDADEPNSLLFLSPSQLNSSPFPARDLVDVKSYRYDIDGVRTLSVIAQLGCPFGCGFCGGRNSPSLRRVRLRSSQNVIAEMLHLYEVYNIRGVMFYDDELNVNKEMLPLMYEIARVGDKLGIEWKLRGFIKAELLTEEQAQAMYTAGFREVLVGFESGSPRILRNINKRATVDNNTRCVDILRKAGIRVKALMSVGHPGESGKTIRETEEWIRSTAPESFDLTRITVYPGSPYYDDSVESKPEIFTFEIYGDRLHWVEVDFTRAHLFYKGDKGDRLRLNPLSTHTDFLSAEELDTAKREVEDSLRRDLNQPFQTDVPGQFIDHSMGMGLPDNILRS